MCSKGLNVLKKLKTISTRGQIRAKLSLADSLLPPRVSAGIALGINVGGNAQKMLKVAARYVRRHKSAHSTSDFNISSF